MSRLAAALIVLGLFALHQDIWFWTDAMPLVFGVLPIGLFYHVAYTLVVAVVLAVLAFAPIAQAASACRSSRRVITDSRASIAPTPTRSAARIKTA